MVKMPYYSLFSVPSWAMTSLHSLFPLGEGRLYIALPITCFKIKLVNKVLMPGLEWWSGVLCLFVRLGPKGWSIRSISDSRQHHSASQHAGSSDKSAQIQGTMQDVWVASVVDWAPQSARGISKESSLSFGIREWMCLLVLPPGLWNWSSLCRKNPWAMKVNFVQPKLHAQECYSSYC